MPGARDRAERGELACGTIDTWLLWRLTNGRKHATDVSNASRTMLFNIHSLSWDEEMLRYFHIPNSLLPEVTSSSGLLAETNEFGGPISIAGAAGDQQASLFGHQCFELGSVKNTYGTGCFLLMNTGAEVPRSRSGLLATVAWSRDGRTVYALEGSVFIAGAAIQWLRDELKLVNDAAETESLARSVPDSNGVYFVPAFVGLGAPHWDAYARGTIVGLTRGAGAAHLVRATLESIAYQTREVVEAMARDSGARPPVLRVDGGASWASPSSGRRRRKRRRSARLIWRGSPWVFGRTNRSWRATSKSPGVSNRRCRSRAGRNFSPAGSAPSSAPRAGPSKLEVLLAETYEAL